MAVKKIWAAAQQVLAADLNTNFRFGGSGADGALSISSGTTSISCASLAYLEKNYTSISITGTGNLAFTSPNTTTGTSVALKSQGNVTITTSSTAAIDMRSMGGGPGNAYVIVTSVGASGLTNGSGGSGGSSLGGLGGQTADFQNPGGNSAMVYLSSTLTPEPMSPQKRFAPPGGNGAGGNPGSANGFSGGSGGGGGLGGGGLYIECGGAYNFTTGAINASGATGANGGNGTGGGHGGGGGGGAGGNILVLYDSLTADSGTYNVAGGSGGTGPNNGQSGASGISLRMANVHHS